MTTNDVGSIVLTQATLSAIIAYTLQGVKRWTAIPWIHANSDRLNRAIAVLLSGVAALGIHYTWSADTGVLTITGLTLAGLSHGLFDWARSAVVTQLVYDTAIKK